MCVGSGFSSAALNPTSRLLGDKYKLADPLMYNLERTEAKAFAAPKIPEPAPLTQESKLPDSMSSRRLARKYGMQTMLTGPTGVSQSAMPTAGNTLLGT